jgi:hypothetical protein
VLTASIIRSQQLEKAVHHLGSIVQLLSGYTAQRTTFHPSPPGSYGFQRSDSIFTRWPRYSTDLGGKVVRYPDCTALGRTKGSADLIIGQLAEVFIYLALTNNDKWLQCYEYISP